MFYNEKQVIISKFQDLQQFLVIILHILKSLDFGYHELFQKKLFKWVNNQNAEFFLKN